MEINIATVHKHEQAGYPILNIALCFGISASMDLTPVDGHNRWQEHGVAKQAQVKPKVPYFPWP